MYAAKVRIPRAARKQCGRCGTAVKENDFCSACREFFRMMSAQKLEFASPLRDGRRTWHAGSNE